MPWPKDHKARTRKRIVQAAAAAFRARGIAQVPVDEVMKSAGLTHGGFYAHFRSKDELVRDALDEADAETLAFLGGAGEEKRDGLHAVIDAYLSEAHAAHPERGCPIAALGPEIARESATTRRRLGARLTRRLEWMKELSRASADARLVPIFACMVGGVILARTAGGERGAAILASCRAFLHASVNALEKRGSRA